MKATLEWSIPKTEEDRAKWPEDGTPCPRCGEPMGGLGAKMAKTSSGEVIHLHCMQTRRVEELIATLQEAERWLVNHTAGRPRGYDSLRKKIRKTLKPYGAKS